MKHIRSSAPFFLRITVFSLLLSIFSIRAAAQSDPLPSWNEGLAKQSILDFVKCVTKPGGKDFVPAPERVAVFDNDGTLWSEQPMYFQLAFALDRVKSLAQKHPEWKTKEPFKSVIAGDLRSVLAGGEHALSAGV